MVDVLQTVTDTTSCVGNNTFKSTFCKPFCHVDTDNQKKNKYVNRFVDEVGAFHVSKKRWGYLIVIAICQEFLHNVAFGDHADGTHFLQILFQASASSIQLLFAQSAK